MLILDQRRKGPLQMRRFIEDRQNDGNSHDKTNEAQRSRATAWGAGTGEGDGGTTTRRGSGGMAWFLSGTRHPHPLDGQQQWHGRMHDQIEYVDGPRERAVHQHLELLPQLRFRRERREPQRQRGYHERDERNLIQPVHDYFAPCVPCWVRVPSIIKTKAINHGEYGERKIPEKQES